MAENTQNSYKTLFEAYDKQTVVKALVGEVSGNGYQVLVCGLPAFLPNAQIGAGMVVQAGVQVDVCIIKIMPGSAGIIVSAKVAGQKADTLKEGQIVEATISSIMPYGAFVHIGGASGLIPFKELSSEKVHSPQDVVSVGDVVKVKVLRIYEQDGRTRIELSLRQAEPDPWDNFPYKVGDVAEATVATITEDGAFLYVGKYSAFLHRSEITWETDYPVVKNYLSVGDKLTVKVMTVDMETKKIAVSLRQTTPDIWANTDLSVGDVIDITVLQHSPSGAGLIVGKKAGIQGTLPRKEMDWLKDKAREYEESVHDGDIIRVVVIEFDKDRRKFTLSRLPLIENPLDVFIREHPVGSTVEGEVLKNATPGIIKISLPCGDFRVAFEPESVEHWAGIMQQFPIGGMLPVKIVYYDPDEKRIRFEPVM